MKRIDLTACLAAAATALVAAPAARADLCKDCKGKAYILSVGKCVECGGLAGSGAFKLCRKCSGKLSQCEHCRGPLGAVGAVRPQPPGRRPPLRPAAQGPLDMKNGGTYAAGRWKYVLVVQAFGTRSQGRFGELYYNGTAVPDPQINDRYRTPWGLLYWNGPRGRFGDRGWMPHPKRGGPGFDQKGKLLPTPKGGAGKPAPIELDDAANGKTINAAAGQDIQLGLKGNVTTGYSWKVKGISGTAVRQFGREQYVQDKAPPGMVGVGGRFLFRFQAMQIGQATISLAYARPWEKNKPPARTFTLTVRVAGASTVDPSAGRAKLLLAEPRNFALHLSYCGPQDKPYSSLLLVGARPKLPRPGAGTPRRKPFERTEHVTRQQVDKLVGHLRASGFLGRAKDALKDAIPPAVGPCYLLRVTGGPRDNALDLRDDLGWGREMFERLDALRAVLFGPAAEAMDALLGRLAGHRKALEAAKPKPEPPAARGGLCQKCRRLMFTADIGRCQLCGGMTSSGAFKLCGKCSGKLKQCMHCRRPLLQARRLGP